MASRSWGAKKRKIRKRKGNSTSLSKLRRRYVDRKTQPPRIPSNSDTSSPSSRDGFEGKTGPEAGSTS